MVLVLVVVSHNYCTICCNLGYRTDVTSCACVLGVITPFWGDKVLRDMGYHSDGIARSRDMGSLREHPFAALQRPWAPGHMDVLVRY